MKIQLCLAVLASAALAANPAFARTHRHHPAAARTPLLGAPMRQGRLQQISDRPAAFHADRSEGGDVEPSAFTGWDWRGDQSHIHLGAFERADNPGAPHPDLERRSHTGVGLAMSFKLGS